MVRTNKNELVAKCADLAVTEINKCTPDETSGKYSCSSTILPFLNSLAVRIDASGSSISEISSSSAAPSSGFFDISCSSPELKSSFLSSPALSSKLAVVTAAAADGTKDGTEKGDKIIDESTACETYGTNSAGSLYCTAWRKTPDKKAAVAIQPGIYKAIVKGGSCGTTVSETFLVMEAGTATATVGGYSAETVGNAASKLAVNNRTITAAGRTGGCIYEGYLGLVKLYKF